VPGIAAELGAEGTIEVRDIAEAGVEGNIDDLDRVRAQA
jgi:hypothetical protein